MTDSALLVWMTFRETGTTADLPEELLAGARPVDSLRDLAVLGHAELEGANRWSVAPPVLAANGIGEFATRAILCGARTPLLISRLLDCAQKHGGQVTAAPHRIAGRIELAASGHEALRLIASDAGVRFQPDAPLAILSVLPRISAWPRTPVPATIGHTAEAERFSRSRITWVPSSLDEANAAPKGFFRIIRDWDRVHVLKDGPGRQLAVEPAVGRLSVARGLKVLRLDFEAHSLSIPAQLRPPLHITRALSVASGTLPAYDPASRTLTFANLSDDAMRLAADILELRFQ